MGSLLKGTRHRRYIFVLTDPLDDQDALWPTLLCGEVPNVQPPVRRRSGD